MIPRDYLFGSFEFPTEIEELPNGNVKASACGLVAEATSREQAVNDLNAKLNEAMERGDLIPTMGG